MWLCDSDGCCCHTWQRGGHKGRSTTTPRLNENRFIDCKLVLNEMTPSSDALLRSTSSLAPSTGPSTSDLGQPQKPERRLESAKYRLSHDVRVLVAFSAPSRVRLAFFSSVPNTCCTHAFSQFARLVRSSSSVSSKSTRTVGTAVSSF
jgi:hypothetical protein